MSAKLDVSAGVFVPIAQWRDIERRVTDALLVEAEALLRTDYRTHHEIEWLKRRDFWLEQRSSNDTGSKL